MAAWREGAARPWPRAARLAGGESDRCVSFRVKTSEPILNGDEFLIVLCSYSFYGFELFYDVVGCLLFFDCCSFIRS